MDKNTLKNRKVRVVRDEDFKEKWKRYEKESFLRDFLILETWGKIKKREFLEEEIKEFEERRRWM